MIVLNEGQGAAHDTLVGYLTGMDRTHAMWVLVGYAGTGKTTTIGTVVQTVMKAYEERHRPHPATCVSAPTHKAVQVLRKVDALGEYVDYSTIHSLLGLKEVINPNTGKQEFKPEYAGKEPPIEGYDILIIDEVSMLPNELFDMLIPYVRAGLKLVMMGDPVQIPPVNEGDPAAFIPDSRKEYNIGILELTEIVRQAADNPILEYATALRKVYKSGNPVPVSRLSGDCGIEVISASTHPDTIRDTLKEHFATEKFSDDPDYMKVIAWTNDTVRHFNAQIRKLIYGEHVTQKIMIGEKLVADAPITNPMVTHSILLHNNQEMVVKEFTIAQKDIVFQVTPYSIEDDGLRTESFTYYDTLVEYERFIRGQIIKMTARIHILHEDYDKLFDDMMDQSKKFILKSNKPAFKKSEMWKAYYGNLNKFARTKYNYAITAHKSQGSTYNNAMMLNWDIDKNRRVEERNRIKYVAATRPRHKLYIVT